MLKFARHNRSSSVDRNGPNNRGGVNDRISVSSLSPRVKVSSPSPSPTSSTTGSTRRRSRTSSLERVSMRNSLLNNNKQVLSQYYNHRSLNPQKHNGQQQQPLKTNFIIPKSSSMFIESIKSHQICSNDFNNTQVNITQHQPMSLDSYQIQPPSYKQDIQSTTTTNMKPNSSSSSVRTANIVNCTNNGGSPNVCLLTSPKSIKSILPSPPTPLMPQKNTIQYPNVNSQLHIINHKTDEGIVDNSQNNTGMSIVVAQQPNNADTASPDYETVYSGTFCRLLPLPSSKQPSSSTSASPSVPMTPTLQKLSAAIKSNNSVIKLKSVLKKKNNQQVLKNSSNQGETIMANNNGYDFHRAIEKLVEKMDLQLLDTSSESGYGSDQDSLTSTNSSGVQVANSAGCSPSTKVATGTPTVTIAQKKPSATVTSPSKPPSLPPRLATSTNGSSPLPRRQPPPIPSPQSISHQKRDGTRKKRVRFDSYVLFLQGLRERDLELVQTHVRDVCDAALATDEVMAEFLATVIEGREAIVRELLAFGFSANTVADPTGMTPLHLAAAFNHLPLVRILLAHGAAVFTRAHSSGKVASELCSRQLPGYQACHAYLRCMEECLGVANGGKVYSTQAYKTTRCDELGLDGGEELQVIRKGDYNGSSWWWCCNRHGQQGYVLQDLLALNQKSNTQK